MATRIEVLLWATRVCGRVGTAAPHELLEIKADATLDEAQDAFHKIARTGHPDLHRGLDAAELEKVTSAYAHCASAYQAFRSAKLRGVPAPSAPAQPIAAGPKAGEPAPSAAAAPTPAPAPAAPARTKRPSEQPQTVRLPGGGIVRSGKTVPPRMTKPAGSQPLPKPDATPPPPTTPPPIPAQAKKPTGGSQPIPKAAAGSQPIPKPEGEEFAADPTTNVATMMSSKALVHYRKAEMALRRGDLRSALLSLKMAIAADPQSPYLRKALTEVEQELKQPR